MLEDYYKIQKDCVEIAPKNATYCSKTIQNDILERCAEVIHEQVIADVNSSKFLFNFSR